MTPLAVIAIVACLAWGLSAFFRERSEKQNGGSTGSESGSASKVQSHAGFANQSSPSGL